MVDDDADVGEQISDCVFDDSPEYTASCKTKTSISWK